MDLGKNDEAFEILSKIKTQYKDQPILHSLLAQYYFQKGNKENDYKCDY